MYTLDLNIRGVSEKPNIALSTKVTPDSVKTLRAEFRGEVLLPEDKGYDQGRKIWNGMIDKHPAMIARCAGASDVIKAVKFAQANSLEVSVRGGGHNVAGNAVGDGVLMIDLSGMKGVRVDPAGRTARVDPGVTWRQFDLETQAFGLGSTGGLVSTTGVAGFTLGGGIGWLVRKHGLALDNLISADVVTAKGELLKASMTENPELFWGIRGGGGNFGVVTSFEFKLHPVGPRVLGGLILHKEEDGKELMKFFGEFVKEAPDELTAICFFFTAPPFPFLPKEAHGTHMVGIALCYSGDVKEGEKVLAPLRKFGKPVADLISPLPYTALQSFLDESAPAGIQNYWKSAYLSDLSDEAIDTILSFGRTISSPFSAIHIHELGGAMARIGEDATAFGHRQAPFAMNIVTTWQDPSENSKHITWTRGLFDAMKKFSMGVYVNFMAEDDARRVTEAYEETKYKRLVSLKNKYDPENFFHMNQNIKPSAT